LHTHGFTTPESIDVRARSILMQEFEKYPYDFRKEKQYISKVTREQIRQAANETLTGEYCFAALVPKKD